MRPFIYGGELFIREIRVSNPLSAFHQHEMPPYIHYRLTSFQIAIKILLISVDRLWQAGAVVERKCLDPGVWGAGSRVEPRLNKPSLQHNGVLQGFFIL
jgi:hypothetical protein